MEHRLNKKQFQLLMKLEEGLLYYRLVRKLAENEGLPASTVRWNLNKLRAAELVLSGDRYHRGAPVRLTEAGRIVTSMLRNGNGNRT